MDKQIKTHTNILAWSSYDTIQAAVLLVKLKHYSKDLQKRQKVIDKYFKLLGDSVCVPFIKPQNTSVYNYSSKKQKYNSTKTKRKEFQRCIILHLYTYKML